MAILDLNRGAAQAAARTREAWSMRLPVLIWLGLIAIESTDELSAAHTHRFLHPLFHFLTGVGYQEFGAWNHLIRKTGHFVGYGALCALLYRMFGFELRRRGTDPWPVRGASLALLGTMAVASLDEWHQTMIPSRTGTFADVCLDSAAGAAALALIFLVRALRAPKDPGRPRRCPMGEVAPGVNSF